MFIVVGSNNVSEDDVSVDVSAVEINELGNDWIPECPVENIPKKGSTLLI